MVNANMSWVTESLATGGDLAFDIEDALQQVQDICDQNVALVIDCRAEASDATLWGAVADDPVAFLADPSAMVPDYLHLPTNDEQGHHIPSDLFDRAVSVAKPIIESGGKVFVHCHMGINRGPSVAYAVLLELGVDPVKALEMIRKARPQAGVMYVQDALLAHQERHLDDPDVDKVRNRKEFVAVTRAHAKVLREHGGFIQRTIRAHHAQDELALEALKVKAVKEKMSDE